MSLPNLLKRFTTFLFVACAAIESTWGAQRGLFIPSDRFSSGLISCLSQDHQGSIWMGTDYGLNIYDGYTFHTFLHDEADSTSLQNNTIVSLLCDRKGRTWVGTTRGLDLYEPATGTFKHFLFPNSIHPRVNKILERADGTLLVSTGGYGCYELMPDDKLVQKELKLPSNYVSQLHEDSKGQLWCASFEDNLWLYTDDGKTKEFSMSMGNPRVITEIDGEQIIVCQHGIMAYRNGQMTTDGIDASVVAGKDVIFTEACTNEQGDLIIGTRGNGIYMLPARHPLRLEPVAINTHNFDVSTAKVTTIMTDRRGYVWIGCQRKGLLMVSQHPAPFNSWNFSDQGIRLGSTVSSVCGGDDGVVWCTVQGVGVYGFNQQGHIVAHPQSPEAVEFIFRDRQKRYWIGTDDGLFSYNPLTGHSEQRVTFNCDKFNDMTSDYNGNIFISTFSRGFCVYNPETGSLRNYNSNETDSLRGHLRNNWVMGMSTDREGLLWLATSWGIACFDPKTESFLTQGWESQLGGIMCFDVCELRSGQLADGRKLSGCIAIGTEEGLYLYDRQKRQAERFPGSEELTNKVVSYIVQSNDGDLWCSTSYGIWCYSMKEQAFTGYINGNGLTQKEYIYSVGMHTDDDMIYFGQNEGLTVFSPQNLKTEQVEPEPLQLTAFRVSDQYVSAGTVINGVEITSHPIWETENFTLSYLDHTFTMAFSQFNFENPQDIILEYRLNGDTWTTNPAGKNDFTLGHLQPGTYNIEVRAKQGGAYSPVKTVKVTIRAPWYRSTLAYIIYFLIAAGLLYYAQRTYRRRAGEKLYEEKMKFLINATHDIRSPLTIILSALKKLERNPAVDTIEHNSKRILDLVNQILDVRKIDKQQMHLHCQQTDIVGFAQGICKMFEFNARERNINFEFRHDDLKELDVWIDRTQFDKVITNLLSNAFKYTYNGGEVILTLKKNGEQEFQLQVTDSGIGIDNDNLKHIFERFYQGSNSRRMHIDGTGIGLNLCKMIVDMHHGTIEAQNRTDGHGSLFTVTLPLGNAHLKPEEMDIEETPVATAAASTGTTSNSTRHRVLIVDDDLEIAQFISNELGHYYKFGICSNGKEGLKELLQNDYDLIISDVMMPEMDGFTMLRMIKTNLNLSHLPVIMLTSKTDVANRLEGLERGADAFLAKPFDMKELHLTIQNLIHGRQHLKGKFSGAQQQADKLEQPEVKGNDEQLMERIMKVVNKNLSDSDFNVEMLCKEVGISRTQLHRKMKEMTGLSTSEFIRNIRLEQAARLLKEQKINVTQVAYTVGFSNLAHFSTIFRKHFGIAPSEYAEK